MMTMKPCTFALFFWMTAGAFAFTAPHTSTTTPTLPATTTRRTTPLFDTTGGWGIGQSRDITPEEFAKGDRRAFEGYQLSDKSDFLRNVKEEQEAMKKQELAELLGVAKIAGINVKSPSERLNKFEPDLLDDDEDLDLSV